MVLIMVVERMKAKMGKGKRVFGYLEVADLFTVLKLLNKPTIAVRESTKLYLILATLWAIFCVSSGIFFGFTTIIATNIIIKISPKHIKIIPYYLNFLYP